jgi:hypothetical protein
MRIITPGKEGEKPHGRLVWTLEFTTFGDPRFVDLSIMPRLTATDSAIQSQSGATGGAVLRELIAASKEVYRISERNHIAWHRLSAALEAAIAHPQATGSAPVGVREECDHGVPYRYSCEICDTYMKRDAALEKERAE